MLPATDPAHTAPLDIAVNIDGDRVRLTVTGELNVGNAHQLMTQAQRYLDQPETTGLVIDLGSLIFIDSSGLRVLTRSRRNAAELGKAFRIQNHDGAVARVIEVTGLT
jgi:anti-anti-sigma factor